MIIANLKSKRIVDSVSIHNLNNKITGLNDRVEHLQNLWHKTNVIMEGIDLSQVNKRTIPDAVAKKVKDVFSKYNGYELNIFISGNNPEGINLANDISSTFRLAGWKTGQRIIANSTHQGTLIPRIPKLYEEDIIYRRLINTIYYLLHESGMNPAFNDSFNPERDENPKTWGKSWELLLDTIFKTIHYNKNLSSSFFST